jgi:molybdopterin-guanine dinucleotide biosynthesis protein A
MKAKPFRYVGPIKGLAEALRQSKSSSALVLPIATK